MLQTLIKSILLLTLLVAITCGIYPLTLWLVGQALFPFQANGSIIKDPNGKLIGSKLIAQAFTKDEYFHPRPSAANYNAAASASSALAASNYALRYRIAGTLGPIVKYTNGQAVGPDIERWLQQNKFMGDPNIVEQWARIYKKQAQAWIIANPVHTAYVEHWLQTHPELVTNQAGTAPSAVDVALPFFEYYAKTNPGKFPVNINNNITHISTGPQIQALFFDMWRQEHPNVALQEVPGDMVTTSASGLDPHITLQNAEFQLARVAARWAQIRQRDLKIITQEITKVLNKHAQAPLAGLAGEKMINVLEVNIELQQIYNANLKINA